MPFIVEVFSLRLEGWTLPRFRSCMIRPRRGVLLMAEEHVPEWNRTSRVARLQDPDTGAPLEDAGTLYDTTLVCARPECWTLSGIERVEDYQRVIEYAQSWLVTPVSCSAQDKPL